MTNKHQPLVEKSSVKDIVYISKYVVSSSWIYTVVYQSGRKLSQKGYEWNNHKTIKICQLLGSLGKVLLVPITLSRM